MLKTVLKSTSSRNVQITSNGVTSRKKKKQNTGNTKLNGEWGITLHTWMHFKSKDRVNFYIQCILRWHSKSDLRVTSSWDHCYDLFIAKRELSKYLILTLLDSVVTSMS